MKKGEKKVTYDDKIKKLIFSPVFYWSDLKNMKNLLVTTKKLISIINNIVVAENKIYKICLLSWDEDGSSSFSGSASGRPQCV